MSIPVTWSKLLEQSKDDIQYRLNYVSDQIECMDTDKGLHVSLSSFQVFAEILYESAVVLESNSIINILDSSHKVFEHLVSDLKNNFARCSTVENIGILNYASLLQCYGFTLTTNLVDTQNNVLPCLIDDVEYLDDFERNQLALAALIYKKYKMSESFLDSKHAFKEKILVGETFGFNFWGFVRYLGAAQYQNLEYADIEPAWLDFLDCFPRKLAAQTLQWSDLFWAARILFVSFQGAPLQDTSHSLNLLVRTR